LAYILVGNPAGFQADEVKAFQNEVIKHTVNIIIDCSGADKLLALNKSKTLAQLKNELLEMIDNCFFYYGLTVTGAAGKSQKFKNRGTFDKFEFVFLEFPGFNFYFFDNSGFFDLGQEKPFIILGADIPVEGADIPGLFCGFQ
jgi:hypothetical protein